MQKRPSKPQRFAAVENDAIDQLPSLLAVGLLTRLIRAQDGEDVTVESLCDEYAEGEKALSKAMRALVAEAFVVKFKIQRATNERVLDEAGEPVLDEKGKPVVKRGGSWYTTFSVDTHRFSAEDVAEMTDAILAGGNVKAIRVEPEHMDPRKTVAPTSERPTPPKGGVGQDASAQVGPTPPFAGVGQGGAGRPTPPRPGVGQGGALFKEETVFENSPSPSAALDPSVTGGSGQDGEEASPDKTNPEGPDAAGSAEVTDDEVTAAAQRKAATDFVSNLPGRFGPAAARSLAPLVVSAMAAGWSLSELRRYLTSRCDATKIRMPEVIYRRDLLDLPDPQIRKVENPCPQHPAREAAECLPCRSFAEDQHGRAEDGAQAPADETIAAMRERLSNSGEDWTPGPARTTPHQRRKPPAELEAEKAAEVEAARTRYLAQLEDMAALESSATA
ncbi:hypothetical protein ACFCX6_31740 [Streptomyces sp. NPDC056353]|uniref:hypothetical protein n=1 Tax=Streptomyces TaxID=1883 RepID=UPI0035DD205D